MRRTKPLKLYPVPSDEDADTVVGEDNLNNSLDSNVIISFKTCNNQMKGSREGDSIPDLCDVSNKRIEDMMPDELMNANPALKELMGKLMKKGKDDPAGKETDTRMETRIVRSVIRKPGENNIKAGTYFNPHVKSPSDTTIYTPALKLMPTQVFRQRNDVPMTSNVANNIPVQPGSVGNNQSDNESSSNVDLEKRISDFIRQI